MSFYSGCQKNANNNKFYRTAIICLHRILKYIGVSKVRVIVVSFRLIKLDTTVVTGSARRRKLIIRNYGWLVGCARGAKVAKPSQ